MVARRWWRNLAGATSVLAALLVVVFGLPALDRAVPADHALAPAHRRDVAAGVSVVPPVGSYIAKISKSGTGKGSMLFLVGPARYVIAVAPFTGTLDSAAEGLKAKIQNMRGYQVTAGDEPIVTDSGLAGITGTYTAPGRIGRFATFTVPGHIIEVTVNGSEADLQSALKRVDVSIASIAYSGTQ